MSKLASGRLVPVPSGVLIQRGPGASSFAAPAEGEADISRRRERL